MRRLPILRPVKALEDLLPDSLRFPFDEDIPQGPPGPGSPGVEYSIAPGYIPPASIAPSNTPFSTVGAPVLPPPEPPPPQEPPESLEDRASRELDLGQRILGELFSTEGGQPRVLPRIGRWGEEQAERYGRMLTSGTPEDLALTGVETFPGAGAIGKLGIAGLAMAGLSKGAKASSLLGALGKAGGEVRGFRTGPGKAGAPRFTPKQPGEMSALERVQQGLPTSEWLQSMGAQRVPMWASGDVAATRGGLGQRAIPADVTAPPIGPSPRPPAPDVLPSGRRPGKFTGQLTPADSFPNPLEQVEEALRPEAKRIWQRINEAKDAFIRGALDSNGPTLWLEKQTGIPVHKLAQRVPGMKAWGEEIIRREFEPVLGPLGKDITELEKYMVIKRGEDILARNPAASGPWGTTGWGGQIDAMKRLKTQLGSERFARIEETAEALYDLSRKHIIQPLYKQGILSKEAAEAMLNAHPHYIDFHRLGATINEVAGGTRPVASLSASGIDRMALEGSTQKLDQPLAQLLGQVITVQERIGRNQAGRALVRGLKEVDPEVKLLGEGTTAPFGKGLVSYFEGGKKVSVATDPIWATVAKGLDAESANWLSKAFMTAASPLRAGATTYNPAFVVINPIRDAISAIFKEGITTVVHPDYVKAWVAAFTKNTKFQEAAEAGALMSGIIDSFRTTKDLTRIAGRRVMGIPLDGPKDIATFLPQLVKEINTASERATRIAAFMKGQRMGKTPLESAIMARDVTVDFSKSGNVVKLLNQAVPFLNAGIQGTVNTFKVMRERPLEAVVRASPLVAVSGLAYLNNQRYETANLIPSYEYAHSWVFQFGEGVKEPDPKTGVVERYPIYVKIPKGPMGALLTAPAEMSIRLAFAKGDRTLAGELLEAAQTMGESLSPVSLDPGSLVFPAAATAVETAANKSFFTGRAIVPQGEQPRPAGQQFGPETSETAVGLGQTFGVSPRLIEFAIRDFTAGTGQTALWAVDTALGALGYKPQVPKGAFAQKQTSVEAAGRTPVVSRFLGVRNTEQERRDWEKFKEAAEKSKSTFARSPELVRLGVFPGEMSESINSGGETLYFTPAERTKMQEGFAKAAFPLLQKIMQAPQYQALNATQRKALIDKVMQQAREQVKAEAVKGISKDEIRRRVTLAAGAKP